MGGSDGHTGTHGRIETDQGQFSRLLQGREVILHPTIQDGVSVLDLANFIL